MANKSRKRMKHEQRLYISRLEQEIRKLHRDAVKYDPITIHASFILPTMDDSARHQACFEMEVERAVRNIVTQMRRDDVIEVVKTPIFMGAHDGYRYDLKLTVLKTQSQRYRPPTLWNDCDLLQTARVPERVIKKYTE